MVVVVNFWDLWHGLSRYFPGDNLPTQWSIDFWIRVKIFFISGITLIGFIGAYKSKRALSPVITLITGLTTYYTFMALEYLIDFLSIAAGYELENRLMIYAYVALQSLSCILLWVGVTRPGFRMQETYGLARIFGVATMGFLLGSMLNQLIELVPAVQI